MCPAHGVFVYWGYLSLGLSKPSFITVKALPGERRSALPILCSLEQTERVEEGFTLASGFWVQPRHNVLSRSLSLSGSLSHTHTYSPGQWLDFNMVMIRDGGSGEGGEGAHIYCRGIGGGAMERETGTRSEWDTRGGGPCLFAFCAEI